MKRTKWFSAHVKPVHVGVYEVKLTIYKFTDYPASMRPTPMVLYCRWDGKQWRGVARDKWLAEVSDAKLVSSFPWRGLTERYKT